MSPSHQWEPSVDDLSGSPTNVRLSGAVMHPSDARLKRDFSAVDTTSQLAAVRELGIYHYLFRPGWQLQPGHEDMVWF